MGKNENSGFYLINYAKNIVKLTNFSVRVLKGDFGKKSGVFLLQSIIHLIFICGILRSFGLILKFTWFFNKVLSNACCKKRKIEQLQAFKMRLGMCDIMSNYMLAQSLVLILTQYEIKNLGNSETCRQNIKVCDALWPEVTNLHDANQ